ncbi:MAG TPA: DEAD/DEAH box helicase [Polyangiaceae bacterium]|nr:DEAD/DEAH box helicase [Polyangiaceae bacterium]
MLATWFRRQLGEPTRAQALAWPAIDRGDSTLLLAPTGSGKTLAAFLVAINRLAFGVASKHPSTRVLYISPLKALGVDVEQNLGVPLAGLEALAREQTTSSSDWRPTRVGIRSGDTPSKERARLAKSPPDILITTPESLYLMLTSRAKESLRDVETVIIDEIHALASTKRGAHLMLSLERLQALRAAGAPPLQRIGLSATQRPLEVVAELLGGGEQVAGVYTPRPVTIVDAGHAKSLELGIELPPDEQNKDSHWPAIHQRVLALIREHRSTMVFVNNRRLAERFAAALNELAGEELVLAHHGSIAKDTRKQIETRLKEGTLPGIVSTSSLELGIDIGAVDLVVQIEAPASVASLLQRVGRAGHQVGAVSRGVIFPKHKSDLLPCVAVQRGALQGAVEATRVVKNPLDVLAQHIVSMLVAAPAHADDVFQLVTRAAPFSDLGRSAFEGVLDMLSGRFESQRFSELRPRINYDRASGVIEARRGARLLAIANAGTIVDRGLYGVYLAGTTPPVRVGELDEEMVFECRIGDVFLLGVSSWRVEEITFDRVNVTPAPGEPGRMPFWRGDKLGRSFELGQGIGALTRELLEAEDEQARVGLAQQHHLGPDAAQALWSYLDSQQTQSQVPTDRRIVFESYVDEAGDQRIVILSPFGNRLHAPWAALISARLHQELGVEVDCMWLDDGIVFRMPLQDTPIDPNWFFPGPEATLAPLTEALGATAVFAAYFRQNASRALLLPRKRPGARLPLWIQRRRASELLVVASDFPDFPIVLETYRECLSDVFDVPALRALFTDILSGQVEIAIVHTQRPSPFASALLFSYVGNFVYSEDAPPAERRARALRIDQSQLQALLGEPALRELLDPSVLAETARQLQRLDGAVRVEDADDVHDLLRVLGDLSLPELRQRCEGVNLPVVLERLANTNRALAIAVSGEQRWIAAEDASRYSEVLGLELPAELPGALRRAERAPLSDLILRFARTRIPFVAEQIVQRWGLPELRVAEALALLVVQGQLVQGSFLPHGSEPEYCHVEVLRRLKQRSLLALRREIEPVSASAYARFLLDWQHCRRPRRGLDGVLEVIEQLQGVVLPYSVWIGEVLPRRILGFEAHDLDELCAAGEILWRAQASLSSDTRLALYLTDDYPQLAARAEAVPGERVQALRSSLATARFFEDLVADVGGFPPDVLATLWELVRAGEVSNDTLLPVRSLIAAKETERRSGRAALLEARAFRSRRAGLGRAVREQRPGSEGRWWLLPALNPSNAERALARTRSLLGRYGVVTREAINSSEAEGGYAAIYPALKALEEAGKIRRGYFVADEDAATFGAGQFAWPGAETRLREHRTTPEADAMRLLSALDPASPYGTVLRWPVTSATRPTRQAGNFVALDSGTLVAYLGKDMRMIQLYVAEDWSQRGTAQRLAELFSREFERTKPRAWLIESLDGEHPRAWLARESDGSDARVSLVRALVALGFRPGADGLIKRPEH